MPEPPDPEDPDVDRSRCNWARRDRGDRSTCDIRSLCQSHEQRRAAALDLARLLPLRLRCRVTCDTMTPGLQLLFTVVAAVVARKAETRFERQAQTVHGASLQRFPPAAAAVERFFGLIGTRLEDQPK